MKLRTKRVLTGVVIAAGSLGALGALVLSKGKNKRHDSHGRDAAADVWARPGMSVTFRAELMPGRDRAERTFVIKELLPSGRVLLRDTGGEHASREFESLR